ncbi:enoyl-CoA hydratase family protein [Streptomyces sp. TRM 70351]|uniref:enoyl-CoA hydratase family protein n=1 Tax=Streptomyces sp. TRM 70351 TaxID=3116552 RepID=UPI002E7C4814|nr:enoyl-CoA hydratase family protein [Streptomyces sp. TRM 70351]MEE1929590.1 enoyl-CoA hydratase family protein [Streptomyces sp. TRM 70351]
MTDPADVLLRADERGVRTLTLNAPENRNALTVPLVTGLRDALDEAAADDTVRAVLLAHTGNTFCSGADLGGRGATPQDLVALLRALLELPKPVLARVTGHVRGGGLGLLGACDLSFAGPGASFAFSEVRIGVAPAVISLPLLPRLEPRAAARYYLTGERFDAAEAARIGLVTGAARDVDEPLRTVSDALRRASPQGLAAAKGLVTAEALRAFDRDAGTLTELSARLFGSAEAREGMTAFLERRDPAWAR